MFLHIVLVVIDQHKTRTEDILILLLNCEFTNNYITEKESALQILGQLTRFKISYKLLRKKNCRRVLAAINKTNFAKIVLLYTLNHNNASTYDQQ